MIEALVRIVRWTGPHKKRLFLGCVCSFFMTWAAVAPILFAAWLLAAVAEDARGVAPLDPAWVWWSLAVVLGCVLVRFVFSYGKNRLQESIGCEVAAQERIRLGTILKRVPLGYFPRVSTGDILAVATTELGTLELQGMKMVDAVINGYVNLAATVAFLFVLQPAAGVAALAGTAVSCAALAAINRTSTRLTPAAHAQTERLAGDIVEYVRGLGTAKSYGHGGAAMRPILDTVRRLKDARIAIEFGFTPKNVLHLSALKLASVGVVACAVWGYATGELALWTLLALCAFSFTIFAGVERVNDSAHMLGDLGDILDRIEAIERAPFIDAAGRDVALERHDIAFEGVAFSYERGSAGEGDEATCAADGAAVAGAHEGSVLGKGAAVAGGGAVPDADAAVTEGEGSAAVGFAASAGRFASQPRRILHDVTFSIPEGSTCAIVGPSGSGKTTIANLMMRFWDVDAGAVRVGGHDVRELTCDSLLTNFSAVFQSVYLFNDTVENNIRFGRPDATREQVEAAARRACADDFIRALPQGYDTEVGEGGGALSGGQRQRISIARALLKDAPIVILDEATASVDPENESLIQAALTELTRGKTVVVIAHRLATIEHADQILVVDGGTIAQRGTHEELLAREGVYRRFVEIRSRAEGWRLAT